MITHDSKNNRFVISDINKDAYIEYVISGDTLTVTHTFVDESLRGKGLAGKLASALFEWAQKNHYEIHSECAYMTAWLKRHNHLPSNE